MADTATIIAVSYLLVVVIAVAVAIVIWRSTRAGGAVDTERAAAAGQERPLVVRPPGGAMPSFEGTLTQEQIDRVAAYVAGGTR